MVEIVDWDIIHRGKNPKATAVFTAAILLQHESMFPQKHF